MDGNDGTGNGRGGGGRFCGEAGAEPLAFDEAEDLLSIGRNDGGAALAGFDAMAEEEKLGISAAFFELGKFEGEDAAGRAFFEGGIERVGIARAEGTERGEDDGASGGGRLVSERQSGDAKGAVEWIGGGAEDGDVVIAVEGDDGGGDEARTGLIGVGGVIWNAEEDGRLGAVELAEDVSGGEEVAIAIDEEGVAVEEVVVAARAGDVVHLIDDGA